MSNVLILPPVVDAWVKVGNSPANVLVLPSLFPPGGPVAPQAAPNYVLQYAQGTQNCPTPCCVVVAHDANSGWWLQLNDRCPAPDIPNPNGPTFPGQCCIEGQPPGYNAVKAVAVMQGERFIGWALDLNLASQAVSLPAWASDKPVRLDAWGVSCCPGTPQQIRPFLKPGHQPPPPPPPTCPPGSHWDPTTKMCVPDQPPPPPQCPPGSHWDPTTKMCVPDQPPPPPPPPTLQPCWPTPNPDQGDELQDGLNCIEQNTAIIATAMQQLLAAILAGQGGSGGANPDPVTCAQLTTQVALITGQLAQIALAITNAAAGGGAPVDLTAVVKVLTTIAATLGTFNGAGAANAALIADSLGGISRAISTAPVTDVSGIVAALNKANDLGDVDQAIFDALKQQGLISAADLQVLQGLKWSDAISYITGSAPVRSVEKFITRAGADADAVAANLAAKLAPAGNWAEQKIVGALSTERNGIQAVLSPILRAVLSSLKPAGATQIGVIGVNPDTVLADVAAVGFNLFVVTALVGILSAGAAEQLALISEAVTGVLGFEELKEVQIGPLVANGIAKIADMQAKAIFKQEIPGTSALQSLVAMGLMNADRARAIAQFNGTPDELYPIMLASSYRGFNPRQLLRLIETGLFTQAEIQDELTFSAMRPVSQTRMLSAAPYLATATQRSALRSALEAAHLAGLLSDQDLTSRIDSAEQNTDRDSLILSRQQLEISIQTAKALETEYTNLFIAGVSSQAVFVSNLEGIGLQQWKVNNLAAVAESRATATAQRQATAAERALVRATDSEARRAAVKNFTSGNIDAAGLAAALALTGLTLAQTAAWVDLAVLQKSGTLRWLYGLQIPPQQAILLRQRVSALVDQRKRLQITDAQFVDALKALKIPPSNINAIRAAADALITPKGSAIVIPVETN